MANDLDPKQHELAQWLTRVERNQTHPNQRWRDAATLILIDRSEPVPKVLLGRRHAGHKFLPGRFVFPGGRVERGDARMPVATPLDAAVEARLLKRVRHPSPAKARAFALAAIRETFEETGLLIGRRQDGERRAPGQRATLFERAGVYPDLASIHFVARALTPPGRPRRFDTRFFAADATAIAHRVEGVVGPDAELVELVWLPITEVERLEMPTITKVALQELEARSAAGLDHDLPVPFYRMLNRRFVREVL
ncbi:MAG TPA: NUDIX hydrolase [Xanthobacteraceae bacterium]|nr:NUDIX hydrolase [Xanthobacteraceae bacterium]